MKTIKRLVPILAIALSTTLHAEQLSKFGDWVINVEDTFSDASTTNEMDSTLGLFCFPEQPNCKWGMTLSIKCQNGTKFPAIVSNGSQSMQMPLVCIEADDKTTTVGVDWNKEFENLVFGGKSYLTVEVGSRTGINRFSLNGVKKAVNGVRAQHKKMQN